MNQPGSVGIALGLLLVLAMSGITMAGEWPACRPGAGRSAPSPAPQAVLLVPLLKGFPDENEPETWPNPPAAQLAHFYRNRFHTRTARLLGVRTWNGFLEKAGRLRERGESFDRIILIGHGGLDGPVLNEEFIVLERTARDAEGLAVRILEAQPGLVNTLTIGYDTAHNPAFAAALGRRWKELARKDPDEVARILHEMEAKLEVPDAACLAHHCPAATSGAVASPAARETQRNTCEWVCRRPLYEIRREERVDAGRFARFAESLSALARPGALIIVGSCNPGTPVPRRGDPRDTGGLIPRSGMAGGPHETYLHLLAAATGRFVAGPVGQASARDIVERIQGLETGKPPRHLRLVAPPGNCPPEP